MVYYNNGGSMQPAMLYYKHNREWLPTGFDEYIDWVYGDTPQTNLITDLPILWVKVNGEWKQAKHRNNTTTDFIYLVSNYLAPKYTEGEFYLDADNPAFYNYDELIYIGDDGLLYTKEPAFLQVHYIASGDASIEEKANGYPTNLWENNHVARIGFRGKYTDSSDETKKIYVISGIVACNQNAPLRFYTYMLEPTTFDYIAIIGSRVTTGSTGI